VAAQVAASQEGLSSMSEREIDEERNHIPRKKKVHLLYEPGYVREAPSTLNM
jgi:hypothetical protein